MKNENEKKVYEHKLSTFSIIQNIMSQKACNTVNQFENAKYS